MREHGAQHVIRHKSLDDPDHRRDFPNGAGAVVGVGSIDVGRATLRPGWRWSNDIKPAVGTDTCEVHHFHVVLAGRLAFQMEGAAPEEFGPGDVIDVPAGHDAWVVGDEDAVLLDISGNSVDFGLPVPRARAVVTMLMSDIVASTSTAVEVGDAAWKRMVVEHDRVVRRQLDRFQGREVKTTGDGFLATFRSAGAALQAALAIRAAAGSVGLELRIGVHTGEVEVLRDDVRGVAVHATARVMSAAQPSEILTTAVTRALAEGADVGFADRGAHELRGFQRPMDLYAVEPEPHREPG
ncbi:MAG TPA: adenylate/guanylate cyclase domain-containing protein [Candidatus Angelobacter sp.]|nr:adenylate/guanylate cyclase domain-containing protein [Candidatus Angelobacter sp.]